MAALSEQEFREINELLHHHFLIPLQGRLQQAEAILKEVARQIEAPQTETSKATEARIEQRLHLMPLAEKLLPPADRQAFRVYFPSLHQQLHAFIDQQEPHRLELQPEERFLPQQDDPTWLRSAKFWKRRLRSLHQASAKISQSLGTARAEGPENNRWTQHIPWQLLLRKHLLVKLLHRLQELLNLAERYQLQVLQAASTLSTLPDRQPEPSRSELLQEIHQRLQQAQDARKQVDEQLKRQLEAISGRLYIELENDYAKAGTLELPARQLRLPLMQKQEQQRLLQIEEQLEGWKNTRLALCSQWNLKLHLYNAADALLLQQQAVQEQWQQSLHQQVFTAFDQLAGGLKAVKKVLAQAPLPEAFAQGRQQLRQQIARNELNAAAEALTQANLANQVQALETPFQQVMAALPETSVLQQATNGKEPIPVKESALTTLHPRELVSLELLPQAVRTLLQKRNEVLQQVEEIRQRLQELQEVSLFGLNSAQAYWEQHQDDAQKARAVAFEGIDRTLGQVSALQERLQQLTAHTWQELQELVQQMGNSLIQLSNVEKARDLHMRLLRARTRQRTSKLQQQTKGQLNELLPRLQNYLNESLHFASRQQERLRSRLGIAPPPATIATELSDFLAENELALQRLPFVYQRLYNIEPLADELFLIGRSQELQNMQEAYRRWAEGKFSPLLITGEKGSGCTSLINIFSKRLPQQQKVIRIRLHGGVPSQAALLSLLAKSLELPGNPSWDELSEHLQKLPQPLVLVVEDLQHLVRRWVGGFEVLKDFLELVSLSSRQVFWLCSCTLYTWQYLDRMIQVSETWGRIVQLQEFNQAHLQELILRRHRVSGFQLQFEPSAADLANKKFIALTADDKQAYLEQKYFQKLALFAQSNLRLALLYWLRATVAVTKNTVIISTGLNPEFGFLLTMPPMRYFILHALLLHEELTAPELARILGEGEVQSRRQLQMLYDDGLLVRPSDGYALNPLLYRQIVNVLKQKNLVH